MVGIENVGGPGEGEEEGIGNHRILGLEDLDLLEEIQVQRARKTNHSLSRKADREAGITVGPGGIIVMIVMKRIGLGKHDTRRHTRVTSATETILDRIGKTKIQYQGPGAEIIIDLGEIEREGMNGSLRRLSPTEELDEMIPEPIMMPKKRDAGEIEIGRENRTEKNLEIQVRVL